MTLEEATALAAEVAHPDFLEWFAAYKASRETERRDLIRAVLDLQRDWHNMTGRWLTQADAEDYLAGRKHL